MLLTFRQGIAQIQDVPLFITFSSGKVSLNANNTQAIINFADGVADYLYQESESVINAWPGPFNTGTDYWLYWDIDTVTGLRTFGTTTIEPLFGNTLPASATTDQHFFDTLRTKMFVFNGSIWNERIRVFAGQLQNGGILIAEGIGSQANINQTRNVGFILFDENGPIKRNNGKFLTTENTVNASSNPLAGYKLEATQVRARADESIPAFHVITWRGQGRIGLASSRKPELGSAIGISTTNISRNEVKGFATDGYITNEAWDFSGSNAGSSLFVGVNGEVTPTVPQRISIQRIGHVVDSNTAFIDIRDIFKLDIKPATPTPTATITPTVTQTATMTPTPTPPAPSPTPEVTPTITPSATAAVTPSATATVTPTLTITPSASFAPIPINGLFGVETFNATPTDGIINGAHVEGDTIYACGNTTTLNGKQASIMTMDATTGAIITSYIVGGVNTGSFNDIVKVGNFLYVVGGMLATTVEAGVVMKLTLTGSIVWQKTTPMTEGAREELNAIAHKNEAGTDYFYIGGLGSVGTFIGPANATTLFKVDEDGIMIWGKLAGFGAAKHGLITGIKNYNDNIVFCGNRSPISGTAFLGLIGTLSPTGAVSDIVNVGTASTLNILDVYSDATHYYIVGQQTVNSIIVKVEKSTKSVIWVILSEGQFESIEPSSDDLSLIVVGNTVNGYFSVIDKATGNVINSKSIVHSGLGQRTEFHDVKIVDARIYAFGTSVPNGFEQSCFLIADSLGDNLAGVGTTLPQYSIGAGPAVIAGAGADNGDGFGHGDIVGVLQASSYTIAPISLVSEESTVFSVIPSPTPTVTPTITPTG